MLPYAANTTLGMPCAAAPLWCTPELPATWYIDNAPLLALKALLQLNGGNQTNQSNPDPLATWNVFRPACTSLSATGTCGPCDWRVMYCGGVRPADGVLTCNFRFVSCRDRRVVGIHLGKTVRGQGHAWAGCNDRARDKFRCVLGHRH